MTYRWPWQGITVRNFSPDEFDHPEKVDRDLLIHLDELRHLCGFALHVKSDVRYAFEMTAIYGPDRSDWTDSPHQIRRDGFGHAVDLTLDEGLGKAEVGRRRVILTHHATDMWIRGHWPRLGFELGTAHVHVDNDIKLLRPWIWPGVSR